MMNEAAETSCMSGEHLITVLLISLTGSSLRSVHIPKPLHVKPLQVKGIIIGVMTSKKIVKKCQLTLESSLSVNVRSSK